MFMELPDGQRAGGGGHGGPVFEPGRLVSVSVHRGLRHTLRRRARPSTGRTATPGAGGRRPPVLNVAPEGHLSDPDVRFVAAVLPASSDLVSATALDGAGDPVEDLDVARYIDFFHREP